MGSPEALSASLQQHLRYILDTASSSPAGGGPAWSALLAHYGIRAFDANERAMSVKYMNLARGALPSEVRVVLEGLRDWATRELQASSAPNAALQNEIASLVYREIARYELSIGLVPQIASAPVVASTGPSLGSIFANAQETSKEVPWANMKYRPGHEPHVRALRRTARAAQRFHLQVLSTPNRGLDRAQPIREKKSSEPSAAAQDRRSVESISPPAARRGQIKKATQDKLRGRLSAAHRAKSDGPLAARQCARRGRTAGSRSRSQIE